MSVQSYRLLRATFFALACGLMLGNATAYAQSKPVETLLPSDPFLVVTWDGIEPHQAAWKKTAAYESLQVSGLGDALTKWIELGIAQVPAKEAGRIKKLAERLTKTGMSMAIAAPADAAVPLPYLELIIHEGAELEPDFAASIGQLAEDEDIKIKTEKRGTRSIKLLEIPQAPPGLEVGWWVEGKHLILTGGLGAVGIATATADGERPNLTASEVWKKYHVNGQPEGFELSLIGWLDIAALLKTYGDMPLPDSPDPKNPLTVRKVAEAAGLQTANRLVFQRGYRGKASWSVSTLETPAARKGLFGLFDGPEMSLAELPPLPTKCSAFYVASIDWSKFYSETIDTVKRASKLGPPDASEQVDQGIQAIPSIIGFNPQTDLFDTFGNVTSVYNDTTNGYLGIGPAIAISLKDSARLKKTIDSLLDTHTQPGMLQVKSAERNGHLIRHLLLGTTGFGPAIVIEKEWFVIALTPQTAEAFALRLDKKLDHWQPSAAEKESLDELPQKFTSISVSEPHRLYGALIGIAPTLLKAAEFGMRENRMIPRNAKLPISAADLPPAELVERPLFPRITIGTSSKDAIRWTTRSSGPTE